MMLLSMIDSTLIKDTSLSAFADLAATFFVAIDIMAPNVKYQAHWATTHIVTFAVES